MFEDFFGDLMGGGRKTRRGNRGQDLRYNLEINLEEAFKGRSAEIKVPTQIACEACAGSQPVYLYAPPGFVTEKHARLHRDLIERGYVRPFAGRIESWTHPRLNVAGLVAAEVKRRFLS